MDSVIAKAVAAMQDRIDLLEPEQIEKLEDACVLSVADWAVLGDKPSLALAEGKIDVDTANALHNIHTRYSTASLAERIIFFQCMIEIRSL